MMIDVDERNFSEATQDLHGRNQTTPVEGFGPRTGVRHTTPRDARIHAIYICKYEISTTVYIYN